jgi:hypothetical protein
MRLFEIPANSVPSERAFSTMNLTHTSYRNRLTVENVDKICYIHINRRILGRQKMEGCQGPAAPSYIVSLLEDLTIFHCAFLVQWYGSKAVEDPHKGHKVKGAAADTPSRLHTRNTPASAPYTPAKPNREECYHMTIFLEAAR